MTATATPDLTKTPHTGSCREGMRYGGCTCDLEWYARPGRLVALDSNLEAAILVTPSATGADWKAWYVIDGEIPDSANGTENTIENAAAAAQEWWDAHDADYRQP